MLICHILTVAAVEYFIKNVYVGRRAYFIFFFWITYEINKLFIYLLIFIYNFINFLFGGPILEEDVNISLIFNVKFINLLSFTNIIPSLYFAFLLLCTLSCKILKIIMKLYDDLYNT